MHRSLLSPAYPAVAVSLATLACLVVIVCLSGIAVAPAEAVELYGCDDASLYLVNPVTGVATLIGALNPYVTGLLGGLEMADGILYGLAGTPGNALWRVDPATAAATMIGSGLGVGLIFEGGLAFDGQDLWGVNQGVGNGPKYLIRIDRDTGTAVVVGMLGTTGEHDFNGLAFENGQLFGIDRVTNALWNITRTDPTLSYQVGAPFGSGIVLGVKGGMAGEYCYADGSHQIFRVDFTTGGAQVLSASSAYFRSFAPVAPIAGAPDHGALLRIETVEPNPTSNGICIRFVVPQNGRLTLAVYDGVGRLVRPLADGFWVGGSHTITWDGRDIDGRVVPGGVYFIRGAAGGSPLRRKIVVVR